MTAGTSVIVHATAISATLVAPATIVSNIGERMTSRPAMEQAMVSAEKETVRPAVATVRTTASRTSPLMSALARGVASGTGIGAVLAPGSYSRRVSR